MTIALEVSALFIVIAAGAVVGRHAWLLHHAYASRRRVRWKSAITVAVGFLVMNLYSIAIYDDLRDGSIDGAALPALVVRPLIILLLFALLLSGERQSHV